MALKENRLSSWEAYFRINGKNVPGRIFSYESTKAIFDVMVLPGPKVIFQRNQREVDYEQYPEYFDFIMNYFEGEI